MKIFSVFLLFYIISYSKAILEIKANGIVKDMVLSGKNLILATDSGSLQIYNYEEKKFIRNIILPKIKDFTGDMILARVFSVDKIEDNYLLLSDSGKGGYSNLWIDKNKTIIKLINSKNKISAIKARFINKKQILLGLLSNEAVLFDIQTKKEIFRVQLNESKFSDFSLNEDKSKAVFSCESGVLSIIDTKTGKLIQELKSVNLDNVYKVDFKKNIISGAGQDRKGALYNLETGKSDFIKGSFLIYATGISPDVKKVAFAMDEKNYISIYDIKSKIKLAELKGQKSTLNTIIFKNENILFSSSEDDIVMMWKLTFK